MEQSAAPEDGDAVTTGWRSECAAPRVARGAPTDPWQIALIIAHLVLASSGSNQTGCYRAARPNDKIAPIPVTTHGGGAMDAAETYDGLDQRIAWWASLESNRGPQSYQDCALTD